MLDNLLIRNRQFKPTYSDEKLTNHLSMALIALNKMGATDAQLQIFFDIYSKNLELQPPTSQTSLITTHNWLNFIGQSNSYDAFYLFFTNQIKSYGTTRTLSLHIPTLMKGIATDAFHCAIRLAYAIDINDEAEIACALAYFASRCTFLPRGLACSAISNDPATVLKEIRSIPSLTQKKFQDNTLIDRFLKVTEIREFAPIINWLQISDNTMDDFAKTAISLYASTNNFTALHLVTATHALRLLLPYISETNETLQYYWQSFCAAYISIGAPEITEINLSKHTDIPWDGIFAETIQASDDHAIKLIYSCYSEDQCYNNPLYNFIATNVIKKQRKEFDIINNNAEGNFNEQPY